MESMTDQLEALASEHEQSEAEAEKVETTQGQPSPETVTHDREGYAQMARDGLSVFERCVQFVEPRIQYPEEEYQGVEQDVGAVLDKHQVGSGIAEEGGHLPLVAEIKAGLRVGGIIKRTIGAVRALWAQDKEKEEEQDNASQRENGAEKPSYAVSSEVGAREESMPQAQGSTAVGEVGG